MSRRKLKSERELVADINKRFKLFCEEHTDCDKCIFLEVDSSCEMAYLAMLLKKYVDEDNE